MLTKRTFCYSFTVFISVSESALLLMATSACRAYKRRWDAAREPVWIGSGSWGRENDLAHM